MAVFAFQDHRFSDEIDKLTGYKTRSILCMTICNSDGDVIGVVQAINKSPEGTAFTDDDEKVRAGACPSQENRDPTLVCSKKTFFNHTDRSNTIHMHSAHKLHTHHGI